MNNILQKIIEDKKRNMPEQLPADSGMTPRRGLFTDHMRTPGLSFICEYKKASPSKGIICDGRSCEEVVLEYEQGGARAVSVLTEENYFHGDPDYIPLARKTVDVPVLQKDFIFTDFQIRESVLLGADSILLIAAVLGEALGDYVNTCYKAGLDVLVEVHTPEEMKLALDTDTEVIGINNRNLDTFEVSLDTFERMASMVTGGRAIVSESGIHTVEDVEVVKSSGADGVLIGESLMRSPDIIQTLQELGAHED